MVRVFPIFLTRKVWNSFCSHFSVLGMLFFGNFPLQIQSTNARHTVFLPPKCSLLIYVDVFCFLLSLKVDSVEHSL